jgi:hypothetical protein
MMLVFSVNAYAGDMCCDMAISTGSSDNIPCHDDTGLDDREQQQQRLCADCVSCAHVIYYFSLSKKDFLECHVSHIARKDIFFYVRDLKPLLKPPNVQAYFVRTCK